jgi:hypothetical protein
MQEQEEEKQAARALQMKNAPEAPPSHNLFMVNSSALPINSATSETEILCWEQYKELVTAPEQKSAELIKTKRNKTRHATITSKGYTFRWCNNVPENTLLAMFDLTPGEKPSLEAGSKGAALRALRGRITQQGGMYLLESRAASTNTSL